MQLTLTKHVQGARVAAYFLLTLGIVFLALAVVGYLKEPRLILPHILAAACGIVLLVSSVAYRRIAGSRYDKAV